MQLVVSEDLSVYIYRASVRPWLDGRRESARQRRQVRIQVVLRREGQVAMLTCVVSPVTCGPWSGEQTSKDRRKKERRWQRGEGKMQGKTDERGERLKGAVRMC